LIKLIYNKFIGLWHDHESVGTKAARGGALTFVSRSLSKFILLFKTIIIARLLFPHDVGLFGLASLILAMTELPFLTGFNAAIIQGENIKKHLDSAWTVNIIRGFFLAGLLYLIAPYGAHFFNNPTVVPIARVLSLMFIVTAFENLGVTLLDKEMKFNRRFFYDIGGVIIQVVSVVIFALLFRNVWALVAGAIAGRAGYVLLSFLVHPYRPRLNFNLAGALHLYKYGKWIGIAGIGSFLVAQGDAIAVGKLIDTSHLAFYQMAFSLGLLPVVETVSVLGGVLFPLFANIQNDVIRLKSVFLRVSKFIYAFMMPAGFGLFILAHEVVQFVYGSRWLPMVPVLYVIIIYGFVRSFEYLATPLLQGIGKPKTTFLNSLLQAGVLFALIIPLTHKFGIVGTAWAAVGGLLAGQVYLLFTVKKEIKFDIRTFLRGMYLPLAASTMMSLVIWEMKDIIPVSTHYILVGYIVLGAIIYFVTLLLLDKIFRDDFYNSFLWIKNNI